jgi:hypothetical protein
MATLWNPVYPRNPSPLKPEIERMVKLAYLVDPAILRPQDIVDFGIDLHRLKEFGEVRLSKPLGHLRKLVPALWGRMNAHQRAAFLLSYVVDGLKQVEETLKDLEREIGDLSEARQGITLALSGLFGKVPRRIVRRIGEASAMWKYEGGDGL